MAKKNEASVLELPALNIVQMTLRVVGDTPLIMHKWSEKAKREMLDKQMKRATSKKTAKDPEADFVDTIYWLSGEPEEKTEEAVAAAINSGARIGFPATGFKKCAIMGAYRSGADIKTTVAKAAIIIPAEFIEIHGSAVTMREDMVKVGGITKVADIRYRAQVENWWADIPIRFNANVMSAEQVVNMFQLGGFACGVGEWRNERDGVFGAFHVATA